MSEVERAPVCAVGIGDAANGEEHPAILHLRPRLLLGNAGAGLEGQLHGVDRTPPISEKLPRERDPGVRRDARSRSGEAVVLRERSVVAAQVEERVAESPARGGAGRIEAESRAGQSFAGPEPVLGDGELGEAGGRKRIGGRACAPSPERDAGAGEPRRVARLTEHLLIAEAEQRERDGVGSG